MKKSDITSLVLIVAVSFLVALFIGNMMFNKPTSRSTPVEIVTPVEAELPTLSADVFNSKSINPTEDIRINTSNTDKPFEE